jgi:glycosyltransferase involved in cell wall biosynthesis
MAGSKMVVVPMKKGLLHSGGQQTYLNAMAMGKPVIVADDCGAKDYIQHGVDGLIVPAGNSQGLREAIQSLISDSALSATLSTNGKSAFHNFSTVACYNKLSRIAGELAELHLVNNI